MLEFSRLELLLGEDAVNKLQGSRVAVFGLGGVGSWAAEALARSAVGAVDLVDADTVDITNINRQLCALHSTVGARKTDVVAGRLLDINPEIKIKTYPIYFDEKTAPAFDFSVYDCVLDCIDSVKSKVLLAELCHAADTPLAASMGAGNRLDPTAFKVGDIFETSGCPLARAMRRELRKKGVERLRCVWSTEAAVPRVPGSPVGSAAFVTPVPGLLMASEAIKYLT